MIAEARMSIRAQFKGAEYPEHVENGLRSILALIQEEVDLSEEEWREVFSTLETEVEFGEADWITD